MDNSPSAMSSRTLDFFLPVPEQDQAVAVWGSVEEAEDELAIAVAVGDADD